MMKVGYFIPLLALLGCETGVEKAQTEAREAAVASDQKVDAALARAKADTNEARREGAKEIAEIQGETKERVGQAVEKGREAVLSATADAREKAADAGQALRSAGESTRLAVERDLVDLEERVVRARENLKTESAQNRAAKERTLADITQATTDLRRDVRSFETKTVQSIEAFQSQLNEKLSDAVLRLEKIEGAKAPAATL